jgi:hypothetical protein
MNYALNYDMDSPLYAALSLQLMNYDMYSDPYILGLRNNPHMYQNAEGKLQHAFFKHSTYSYEELKTLKAKYEATAAELGASVADWCLQQCIARFRKHVRHINLR